MAAKMGNAMRNVAEAAGMNAPGDEQCHAEEHGGDGHGHAGNKRGAGEFHGSRQHEAVDESDDRFECAEREQGVAYFVHRFTTGFGARACRNGLEGFVCAQTATGLLQAERAAYQKRNGKNRRQGAVCGGKGVLQGRAGKRSAADVNDRFRWILHGEYLDPRQLHGDRPD